MHVEGAWSLPPAQPWDHPDWVLARAVAAAVIDPDDHLLISATRLDDVPVSQVADRLGIPVTLAVGWRRRAEHRIARAIAAGELAWAPLLPQPSAAAARRRVGSPTGVFRSDGPPPRGLGRPNCPGTAAGR